MIEFYKDTGGSVGYRLIHPDGHIVLEGDGNESKEEVKQFFFEVAQALEGGLTQDEEATFAGCDCGCACDG